MKLEHSRSKRPEPSLLYT